MRGARGAVRAKHDSHPFASGAQQQVEGKRDDVASAFGGRFTVALTNWRISSACAR